jgi:hypothetical protein
MATKRAFRTFELVEKMVADLDILLTYRDILDDDAVKKAQALKDELYSFLRLNG